MGLSRNFFLLRSFGIIELRKKTRKIFEFKGLIRKIFRNKDLAPQRALKMGLGQLRGPFWETGTLTAAPIWEDCRTNAGWKSVMTITGWM
jgi:hypothetical protein